jgi:hypothetical protein
MDYGKVTTKTDPLNVLICPSVQSIPLQTFTSSVHLKMTRTVIHLLRKRFSVLSRYVAAAELAKPRKTSHVSEATVKDEVAPVLK